MTDNAIMQWTCFIIVKYI